MKKVLFAMAMMLSIGTLAFAQETDLIYLKNSSSYRGFICEQVPGEYICIKTNNGYTIINWTEIDKTVKLNPDIDDMIEDVISLKDGSFVKGKITEQSVGSHFFVQTSTSETNSYSIKDINSINTNYNGEIENLWNDLEFYDRIDLVNGTILEGFIKVRNLGKSITIYEKSNLKDQTVPLENIKKLSKVVNPDYYLHKYIKENTPVIEEIDWRETVRINDTTILESNLYRPQYENPKEADKYKDRVYITNITETYSTKGIKVSFTNKEGDVVKPVLVKLMKDKKRFQHFFDTNKLNVIKINQVECKDGITSVFYDNLTPGAYMIFDNLDAMTCTAFYIKK